MKIIKFDGPLIGMPNLREGYRISFDIKQDVLPPYDKMLNYLCDTFGECFPHEHASWHEGPGWSLSEYALPSYTNHKRLRLTIVVDDMHKLVAICNNFQYPLDIDYTETLSGRIESLIEPLLFSKVTRKHVAYLRQKIAELIHKQWYQVRFNVGDSTIEFEKENKQYRVQVGT